MSMGIYKITNKINGKSYIGQSVNIERRFSEHKVSSHNPKNLIHKALNKYGIENWFIIVKNTFIEYFCIQIIN